MKAVLVLAAVHVLLTACTAVMLLYIPYKSDKKYMYKVLASVLGSNKGMENNKTLNLTHGYQY